jgi:hypothetical protein
MDIVASAQAAATLAGMFLEIVQVTKHVIAGKAMHLGIPRFLCEALALGVNLGPVDGKVI